MDKFKELLAKAGVKPEFIDQICESLDRFKTTIREQADASVVARVEAAKKVCIEETNTHKSDLARRLQVFCETKQASIEAAHLRQATQSEAIATSKLRDLKALLEGVELNGADKGQTTAAVENAKRQIQHVQNECNKAVAIANRQTAIAENVVKRNKLLVAENAKLKRTLQSPVVENRQPAKQPSRLDGGRRQNSVPATTRPTLTENQDPRPSKPNGSNIRTAGNDFSISSIAESIVDDVI